MKQSSRELIRGLRHEAGKVAVMARRTWILIVAATFLHGVLAGLTVDRSLVGLAAWHEIGVVAWANYSRSADLGNGLVLYPGLAISGALLSLGAAKFRILCTEDDADTRDLIVLLLNSHNCEVVTSASSHDSLFLARTQHFDLYLLDNWLPGSSGVALCKKLRRFDSKTPILFYSGAAYDHDKKDAEESGAQGYVTKPADGDELVSEVLRLISASRLSRN